MAIKPASAVDAIRERFAQMFPSSDRELYKSTWAFEILVETATDALLRLKRAISRGDAKRVREIADAARAANAVLIRVAGRWVEEDE